MKFIEYQGEPPDRKPHTARYRWNIQDTQPILPLDELAKKAIEFLVQEEPSDAVIVTYMDPPYIIMEAPLPPKSHPIYGIVWEAIPYSEALTAPVSR